MLPLSPKSDPSMPLSQQDTSARSSPLVSSLFDDSPDKDTQASEPTGEAQEPRAHASSSANECGYSCGRNSASTSNSLTRPPGFCWVISDRYGQCAGWLPKGYHRIQCDGLLAKVRERLRRNGLHELNKKLEDQRVVRYLLGNNYEA